MNEILSETNINVVCRACLKQVTSEMLSIFDNIEYTEESDQKKILILELLVDASKIDVN